MAVDEVHTVICNPPKPMYNLASRMNNALMQDYILFLTNENILQEILQTLRKFSLVTATEPSHTVYVFTSTRPQQVTDPNMKDYPKDLVLV